ncbi:trafficking protein particle complex subunit 5-like [Dreissena polymorpha]|uniref:trafficking protein particle complex subunit 5-like n=1 Tax=Dreissena polymorpha TaxID=45954 RepID=UPI00226556A8|nr:trafficking protein particle complex subunit 5-like [Dreissena polymorpha]
MSPHLLFSEIVQYCQNRVYTVPELQNKLSELGQHVGNHLLDVLFLRERGFKRETKHLNMLLFIKRTFWRVSSLNCASFTAGIIEAVLNGANFPAKVTAHYHKGTTFMIKFDESVIARDKLLDGK